MLDGTPSRTSEPTIMTGRLRAFLLDRRVWLAAAVVVLGLAAWLVVANGPRLRHFMDLILAKPKVLKAEVVSWGTWGPVIFILLQALQVVVAPVPGEATGVLGGYLFGAWAGFLYSSLGLTLGSWMNLALGRYLGRRIAERLVPDRVIRRFDFLLRAKAVFVLFVLFVIPGFPKDYMCVVLGMSKLPLRVLLLTASLGRIPGTLILSLQGAQLYEGRYFQALLLVGICVIVLVPAYLFREHIYEWTVRWQEKGGKPTDPPVP